MYVCACYTNIKQNIKTTTPCDMLCTSFTVHSFAWSPTARRQWRLRKPS
jgi:hypothetical protein